MNVDIITEHVAMRPEWHDIIGTWLEGCRRRHPDVQAIDLRIQHADSDSAGERVDLVALARGRSLHTSTRATDMGVALYDALDSLERELTLNEAIRPTTRQLQ